MVLNSEECLNKWSMFSLKDITNNVKVGFVGSCNKYYCSSEDGVPMIRTTNLYADGVSLEKLKYVTNEFHVKNKKSQLKYGDLLIARHGNNGLASLWNYNIPAQCLNVVVVEPNENIANKYYLKYMINSPFIQKQIKSLVGGSVQNVVNTKDIADLLIPLPPLDIQKSIVEFLIKFDKKIENNKKINHNLNLDN